MIDELTIQRVKDAANVKDVIEDFYDLKIDGAAGYTCLCPFHQDRHIGSFKVSEAKNIYTCYSCGAHGGPVDFLMQHEKMTFPDAIRWLGKKYGIEVEGADKYTVRPCQPHTPAPPLPMLTLPAQMVKRTRSIVQNNTLVNWIKSLRWNEHQQKRIDTTLTNYLVGGGKEGHTIFWQADETGNVRTGKMMLYKADGHRDKETPHNFDWIHAMLYRSGHLDPMAAQYETCYFGQHLLNIYPDATIHLVESEKTALICAIAYGQPEQKLWIATGGLQFFKRDKLKPFIDQGRHIVIYPDKDGVDEWSRRAQEVGYEKLHINTSIIRDFWTPADGDKADIADILVRLMKPQGQQLVLEQMIADNPAIQTLIDNLNLQIQQ